MIRYKDIATQMTRHIVYSIRSIEPRIGWTKDEIGNQPRLRWTTFFLEQRCMLFLVFVWQTFGGVTCACTGDLHTHTTVPVHRQRAGADTIRKMMWSHTVHLVLYLESSHIKKINNVSINFEGSVTEPPSPRHGNTGTKQTTSQQQLCCVCTPYITNTRPNHQRHPYY